MQYYDSGPHEWAVRCLLCFSRKWPTKAYFIFQYFNRPSSYVTISVKLLNLIHLLSYGQANNINKTFADVDLD